MTWKNLDERRIYRLSEDGFYIIKPKEEMEIVPFECPVCELFMKDGADDVDFYKLYKCCSNCAIKWAEPNKKKWLEENWRPPKEEIEKEVKKRLVRPFTIKIF